MVNSQEARHSVAAYTMGVVLAGLLVLNGCSDSFQPTSFDATHGGIAVTVAPSPETAGATQAASSLPIAALGPATTPTLDCVGMAIGVITINVRNRGGGLVKTEDFSCQHGNGIIDNIPAGGGYQVEIIGRPGQGGRLCGPVRNHQSR